MSSNYDISQHKDGGFQAKREGATRAAFVTRTQTEAIAQARQMMHQNGGGELRIHGLKGYIRASDTIPPKVDKFPPRG
ncbi:MAG: DUF2188 domain-containing protein [Candidatus Saccharibacteria bacterium]